VKEKLREYVNKKKRFHLDGDEKFKFFRQRGEDIVTDSDAVKVNRDEWGLKLGNEEII
jgi:hypothetical protein